MPTVNPGPLQLISIKDDHSFSFQKSTISEILLQNDIKDRKIVVLSVAGAFRKGKSFILGFFLRYLRATYQHKTINPTDNWLGDPDTPLEGFKWRGGSKRETTGINMWSEVFLYDKGQEKIAIILLDTQGVFDNQTSMKENVGIFSLSALLSSVQIYNIMQQIQEDDLQNLQLFTEYGRWALNEGEVAPFQNLLFLIRDWRFPYEHEFGFEGGSKFLKQCLQTNNQQANELQKLRSQLSSCFSNMKCFLMPYPGDTVSFDQRCDGRLKNISMTFIDNLNILVPKLLGPENLVLKTLSGTSVTATEFLTYLESYVNLFNQDDIPSPKSLFQTTAEASQLNAITSAKSEYTEFMDKVSKGNMKPSLFEAKHVKSKAIALQKFQDIKKIGNKEMVSQYSDQLKSDIDILYQSYKKRHNDKFSAFVRSKNAETKAKFIKKLDNDLDALLKLNLSSQHFKAIYKIFSENLVKEVRNEKIDGDENFEFNVQDIKNEFESKFSRQNNNNNENTRKRYEALAANMKAREDFALMFQRSKTSKQLLPLWGVINPVSLLDPEVRASFYK